MNWPGSRTNPQVRQEATEWFVAFCENEPDAKACESFLAWLRSSPEHVRTYLRISAFWAQAGKLADKTQMDIDALLARACAEHDNVVALQAEAVEGGEGPAGSWRERRVLRRPMSFLAVAATLLVAIGAGVGIWSEWFRGTYATGIGELRTIRLEDGSSVELNAQSRVRIAFTKRERRIELLAGQALFRVQKEAARPFIVAADATSVRAVGTQFDVYRKSTGTIVTVLEGRVAVSSKVTGGAKKLSAELAAGQQLTVGSDGTAASGPAEANVVAAVAWTEGKLVFDSAPLGEVVEEFNRYNRTPLVIEDAGLRAFHISGVFPSTDSAALIAVLEQRFNARIDRRDGEIHISAP